MRVIGGELKGRRLASWPRGKNPRLRPMTDRARESLFGQLLPRLPRGFLFLDLFSGTGSLAIEALSRGAGQAHAVELHPGSLRILEKNRQILPRPEKLVVHKMDVFAFLKKGRRQGWPLKEPFALITADPPFALKAGARILKRLADSSLWGPGSLLALEAGRGEELSGPFPPFRLFSKKSFNDKKIWLYEAEIPPPGGLSRKL